MLVFSGWEESGRVVSGERGDSLGFSQYHLSGFGGPSGAFGNLLGSSRGVLGAKLGKVRTIHSLFLSS